MFSADIFQKGEKDVRPDFVQFDPRDTSDEKIKVLLDKIAEADAVVVGGASGMSTSGGDSFYDVNPTFLKYFGDFYQKFGANGNYDGVFPALYYRYPRESQRQAAIARIVKMVRDGGVSQQYWDLKELLEGKDFFVLTTNQDQLFRRTFGDDKVAFIQGDWGWYQCGNPCCDEVWDNRELIDDIVTNTHDCEIDDAHMPVCPRCGSVMEPWVRGWTFLEGTLFKEQHAKFNKFLEKHIRGKVLFLELGVGAMTPMFIKEPFWSYTYQWPGGAFYVPITVQHAIVPNEIADKSMAFDADIAMVLHRAVELKRGEKFITQSDEFKTECAIEQTSRVGNRRVPDNPIMIAGKPAGVFQRKGGAA